MDDEHYSTFVIGESKFDRLRRISVIKKISDDMGLEEGDIVEFTKINGFYAIQKKPREEEMKNIQPLFDKYTLEYKEKQLALDEIYNIMSEDMDIYLTSREKAILKSMIAKDYFLYTNGL